MTKVLNLKHSDEYLEDYTNEELDTLIKQIEKAKSPKFKVGDWIVHSNTVYNYIETTTVGWFLTQSGNEIQNKYSRLATEEEIEKAIKEQGKGYFVFRDNLFKLHQIFKDGFNHVKLRSKGEMIAWITYQANQCRLPTIKELESLESKLPNSWEEFVTNENNLITSKLITDWYKLPFDTVTHANKLGLFQQLLILRDVYRNGWKPDYNNGTYFSIVMNATSSDLIVEKENYDCHPYTFSFQTKELRDLFFKNFKSELESIKEFL